METLILICSILSLLISLPAIVLSLYAIVELKAFKKSTHKVEFMPVPTPTKTANQEFLDGFQKDGMDEFLV